MSRLLWFSVYNLSDACPGSGLLLSVTVYGYVVFVNKYYVAACWTYNFVWL